MRYDGPLLKAEATQHLASCHAAEGDAAGAIEKYGSAIAAMEALGPPGQKRLCSCHHDLAGLLAVEVLGAPGSKLRRLRDAADQRLPRVAEAGLKKALRHAATALRLAERAHGRASNATAQMHFAVGKLARDARVFSPAIYHLGQSTLINYHFFVGYGGVDAHPDVDRASTERRS